jgi:hypothetical protein
MTRDELILILDGMHDKMEFLREYFKKEEEKEKKKFWVPKYKSCCIHGEFSEDGKSRHEGILKGYHEEMEWGFEKHMLNGLNIRYEHFRAPVQTVDNCTVKIGSLCKFWSNDDRSDLTIGYFNGVDGNVFLCSYSERDFFSGEGIPFHHMEPWIETFEDGKLCDAV